MKQLGIPFRREIVVDSFAGGGGASVGIERALGRPVDIAVNHSPEAIAMHEANHPGTRHLCGDVFDVDPLEVTGGQPVGLAWFSPDCTHFSKAKGGRPVEKKIRGLAWIVIRWAARVKPRVIMLENVEEFEDWGPLDADNKPCPRRKGLTFRRWRRELERRGYVVETRLLRACDYGAPTTRRRLFVVARCDGRPIVWPEPTHGTKRQPYRTAAECIDWSLPCPSIFERKRPLAEATQRRIARGIWKYVLTAKQPFPFVMKYRSGSIGLGIDEPMHTVTANSYVKKPGGAAPFALVSPTLIQTSWGERPGQAPRVPGLDKPLGTIMGGGCKHALVMAYLAKHFGGHETPGAELGEPMSTVTARDHHALVTSWLCKQAGGCHYGEVRAFLTKFYGQGVGQTLDESMHTVTSKDHFGLVTVAGEDYHICDIGMRMLEPHELFRAQGFPTDYVTQPQFRGRPMTKTAQIRLCGNSVAPPITEALVRANFAHEQRIDESGAVA